MNRLKLALTVQLRLTRILAASSFICFCSRHLSFLSVRFALSFAFPAACGLHLTRFCSRLVVSFVHVCVSDEASAAAHRRLKRADALNQGELRGGEPRKARARAPRCRLCGSHEQPVRGCRLSEASAFLSFFHFFLWWHCELSVVPLVIELSLMLPPSSTSSPIWIAPHSSLLSPFSKGFMP